MKNYTSLRKIVDVFHLYGINLTGKRKFANFYTDLKMQHIFVSGLIYELELASNGQLNDEEIRSFTTPAQIVNRLIVQ
ncbi:hypothetical protein GCM10011506_09940 [Marivirga lumbricoides]|uniref:Acyl carrier protein n=1 Tax=Marivirga lumbricoides TaxID=1046115 RepID=A0ABQ1LMD9_9BACT|nr:hypothetical protein GCM10011506_09940 [Marivirga lumbricoides]